MKPILSFDALTLHAVADEARAFVVGGRVQRVMLLGPNALGLELYSHGARTNLLISADPHAARVCLTREPLARASETVTPLLLLLRKYVRDGRLESLYQPELERTLELRFRSSAAEASNDPMRKGPIRLIIEVMGRRSNAVLVSEDGAIMDALRRASREKNPSRPILPRLRYEPPPPQDRLDPFAADTWELLAERRSREPMAPVAELLGSALRGFSPLLSREVAFRAAGQVDAASGAADWAAVRQAALELLAPVRGQAPWRPSIARWQERVVAFAPYGLTHLAGRCTVEPVDSISAAVDVAYGDVGGVHGARPALDQILDPLLEAIDARRADVERRRRALERSREAAGDPEALREAGELILASLATIGEGQSTLEMNGRTIDLDPTLSPLENAQRYFREYRKARDAARRVPELLARTTLELDYLDETRALAELIDDPARLRALRDELRSAAVVDAGRAAPRAARRRRGAEPRPITVQLSEGFSALVGTSANVNERITFDLAGQEDIWLHARNVPGAHVIVRTGGRAVPGQTLVEAAALAAYYSRGRHSGRVDVDWTLRKFVRKIRGGPPGRVSYINEHTISATPRAPDGR